MSEIDPVQGGDRGRRRGEFGDIPKIGYVKGVKEDMLGDAEQVEKEVGSGDAPAVFRLPHMLDLGDEGGPG